MPNNTPIPTPAPLLVDAREAARLLAISPRTLWTLTKAGDLPAVRIGRSVRYSTETLRACVAWWEGTADETP